MSSITNSGTLGGGGSYSHDANGNVTHDGLAGLDLQYNLLNLTKRISSGGTTLADYHYLADGMRVETSDYLPFGKRWELTGGQAAQTVTDPTNRWRFSGKYTSVKEIVTNVDGKSIAVSAADDMVHGKQVW